MQRLLTNRPCKAFILALLLQQPVACLALSLNDVFDTQQSVPNTPAKQMLDSAEDTSETSPCAADLSSQPLTLLDVIEQSLCNSPRTAEAWAGAKFQAAQLGVQQSNYLPRVNFGYGISKLRNRVENSNIPALDQDNKITSRASSLRLSWLLADFGQRSAKLAQAQSLLDAANSLHDVALQEVFMSAAQSYFDALSMQSTLKAFEDSEQLAKESLAAATAKFKAGVGLLTDQLQAQTAYSQARLDRTKSEGDLKNAYGTLATVMGLVANTRFSLLQPNTRAEQATVVSNVDNMMSQAARSHPTILAAKAKLSAAQFNIKAARAEGLPTLSLNSEISRTDQLGQQQLAIVDPSNVYSKNNSIGLQLNIPIFEGFERSYRVQSANAERELRNAELSRATKQVGLDVWKSYNSLISERDNLRAADELVQNSQDAFNMVQGRYRAGVGNIIELLNAQNVLANARQQQIKSLSAWRAATLRLSFSMGDLGLWAIAEQ